MFKHRPEYFGKKLGFKGVFHKPRTTEEKLEEEKLEAIAKFEENNKANDYVYDHVFTPEDKEKIGRIMEFLKSDTFLSSDLGQKVFEFSNERYRDFNYNVPYENLSDKKLIDIKKDVYGNPIYKNYLEVLNGYEQNEIPTEVKEKIAEDAYVYGELKGSNHVNPGKLDEYKVNLDEEKREGIIPFIATQIDSLQQKVKAGEIKDLSVEGGKKTRKHRKHRKSKKARKSHKKRNKSHRKK